MRLLIAFLMGLSLSIAGLPATASPAGVHAVQGRGKKKRPRPTKAKKAEKKADDKKKNDRGFEL